MASPRKIRDNAGVVRRIYERPQTGMCTCGNVGRLLNTNSYECEDCSRKNKALPRRRYGAEPKRRPGIVIPEYHTNLKMAGEYDPQNWSCYK